MNMNRLKKNRKFKIISNPKYKINTKCKYKTINSNIIYKIIKMSIKLKINSNFKIISNAIYKINTKCKSKTINSNIIYENLIKMSFKLNRQKKLLLLFIIID